MSLGGRNLPHQESLFLLKENIKFQEKACPSMTPSTPLRPHPLCTILRFILGMFSSILTAIIIHLGPLSPIMCHLAACLWHVLGHLGRQHRSPWAHETPKRPTPPIMCHLGPICSLICVIFGANISVWSLSSQL